MNENSDNYGKYIDHILSKPHYKPVSVNTIDTIEINIRDDTGEPIHFEAGWILNQNIMDKIYDQKGAGGMPVYYGARYQRGMGIGSMFKSFARWILLVAKTHVVPVLKDAA